MILASNGIIASQIATTDADALAFFNRVTTAGGSLSTTEKSAVNQLVLDLKSYSIWTKMKAIYPMVGASAAACAQNLVSSSFTGTFNGGWTYASTGVTGNGVNGYMNTGLNINANLLLNSSSFGFYIKETASKIIFLSSSGGGWLGTWYPNVYTNFEVAANDGFQSGISISNQAGYFQVSRNASNNVNIRHNGNTYTKTGNSTSIPNTNAILGATNLNNAYSDYYNKEIRFFDLAEGLSSSELSLKYTAVQAFQTTLSRQV